MINLAVIYGSRACEHDVSIVTALQAMANANTRAYRLIPVYIGRDGRWFTGDALRDIDFYQHFDETQVIPCRLAPLGNNIGRLVRWPAKRGLFGGGNDIADVDCALLCLHGLNGEDGTVQGLLELYDIPYTSAGLLGSAAGMDKIAMKRLYQGCGFPVLDMVWCLREDFLKDPQAQADRVEAAFGYPCFVKPANLGSSIGISKAKTREDLLEAMTVAAEYDKRILIEKGLDKPIEVNCSALGYGSDVRVSVCEMPTTWEDFLTYEDKYLSGGKGGKGKLGGKMGGKLGGAKAGGMASLQRQIPAPISDEQTKQIQQLTAEMFKVMDLKGVVRVDFLIDSATGKVYLNEVNTIPGSLAYYLWEPLGLSYAQLIDELVKYAVQAAKDKDQSTYSYDSTILQKVSRGALGSKR